MLNPRAMAGRQAWATLVALVCISGPAAAQQRTSAVVPISVLVRPMAWIDFPDGFDFHLYVPDDHSHGHDDHHNKKGKGHDHHGNGHGYGHDGHSGPRLIKPVVIPFKVRGNTVATVSARPGAFLRLKSGAYLGKAVRVSGGHGHPHGHDGHHGHDHDDDHRKGQGHDKGKGHGHGNPQSSGNAIGYNVIMQFPMASWQSANPGSWEIYLASYLNGFATLPGLDGQGTRPLSANLAQRPNGTFGVLYIVSRVNWTADGKEAAEGKYGGSVELTLTPVNN